MSQISSSGSIPLPVSGASGGTGINNSGKTITLSGSLATGSGSGATTLSFGSGTNTYAFPPASVSVLTTNGITFQSSPSNPTGTSGVGTYTMMGLGGTCTVTPANSTRVYVQFTGYASNNTSTDGAGIKLAYGTGAAPINGAAATGTTVGANPNATAAGANYGVPFTVSAVISGLSISTAYWFDLQLTAIVGGTATVNNIGCTAYEV